MSVSTTDSIHKQVTLRAPRARVWRALTDSAEFGEWFGVQLDGPFQAGQKIVGKITHPGCEKMVFEAWVESMDPEQLFSFRWRPQDPAPDGELADEPTTLVEFRLEQVDAGSLLTVVESGFDAIPEDRRREAFQRNEGGWVAQMENIQSFVDG